MPAHPLIAAALPLDAINKASAYEKSTRHGHPSAQHLWWARRPLAICRAMLAQTWQRQISTPEGGDFLPLEAPATRPRSRQGVELPAARMQRTHRV